MPQTVNPDWGYIANANNDPIGTTLDNNPLNQLRPGGNGIYYLNPGYADYRQGRVDRVLKELVESGEPVTAQDMKDLQANVDLLDAELTLANPAGCHEPGARAAGFDDGAGAGRALDLGLQHAHRPGRGLGRGR